MDTYIYSKLLWETGREKDGVVNRAGEGRERKGGCTDRRRMAMKRGVPKYERE